MTVLPAVVTIPDLPTGTTITGTELLEAAQTVGGVLQSVQVSISQIMTTALGGLPTGGATGQFLQKSSATNFGATWASISSNVLASTGLAQSGSTTVSLSLASTAGLSVLGVGGTGSAVPGAIAGIAAQVFRINDAGTAAAFGALNIGSAAAVTGVLPGANMSAVNLSTGGAGGVQNILQAANITAINVAASGAGGIQGVLSTANMTAVNVATTGGGGIQGQPFFLPTTALPSAGSSTVGIKISSASLLGIYVGTGAPTFTAGTSSLYLRNDAANATSRLYININGTGTWANFTASA